MKTDSIDVVDRLYGVNPFIAPYAGVYTNNPYQSYTSGFDHTTINKDVKKFSTDEWESWPTDIKKKKKSAALSALTLVAFLFFLNLLQTCLKEQMMAMNPTIMVMTASAGRDEEEIDLKQRSSEIQHNSHEELKLFTGTVRPSVEIKSNRKKSKGRRRQGNAEPRISTTIAPKLMNKFMNEDFDHQ